METSQNRVTPQDVVAMWLKRLVLLMAAVLLGFCCWLVWRVSMVASRSETAITAVSADVKKMSESGAQISQHLQQLDERLRSIEEKAAGAMKLDEVEHLFDEVGQLRGGDKSSSGSLSPQTEREINYLLAQVRRSNYRFTYSDENKSGTRFYVQLYAKYKTYDRIITSAEDFIDKVGTKTITGHPYQVVIDDKQTTALSDWLTAELKKFREAKSKSTSAE